MSCRQIRLLTLASVFLFPLFPSASDSAHSNSHLPLVEPAEAGFDAAKLDHAAELYRETIANEDLHGAVLLVARNGKVALHEAIGWRDREERLPMEPDTLFRMASNTKPVVTTAALILAEEGQLSIDKPVAEYIPAFSEGDLAKITVAQLMTHSSGLPRSPILPKNLTPDSNLIEVAEQFAATLKLQSEPGTEYLYSNVGFNVLGGVIEKVSGQRLDHLIADRIYKPLGMTDSSHYEADVDHGRMGKVYRYRNDEWTVRWSPGDPPSYPIIRASGGMISTAAEYAIFLQMWLDGGNFQNVRLLPEERIVEGRSVQSTTGTYGYGWHVDEANGFFAHGGSDGTYAWVDPQRNLIGLVFTQSPGGENPRDEFRERVNAALLPHSVASEITE